MSDGTVLGALREVMEDRRATLQRAQGKINNALVTLVVHTAGIPEQSKGQRSTISVAELMHCRENLRQAKRLLAGLVKKDAPTE